MYHVNGYPMKVCPIHHVSKRLTNRCESGEYDCILGEKCISIRKFRDGIVDCLDGSDEFCYPGQVKCGSICVELQFLGECLANPTCDNSTKLPVYCDLIKPKLCRFADAVPCKGYGDCVLRKWLDDGNKDCFDGSDEDPDYIRLLSSCLYPVKESQLPDGFIKSSTEIPEDELRNQFPGTQPDFERPESGTGSQTPPSTEEVDNTQTSWPSWPPWDFPEKNGPTAKPPSISDELVPINPFVRVPPTPRPAINTEGGPVGYGGSYGGIEYPPGSGSYPNQRPLGPNFGSNGVLEGGSPFGPPMNPVIPFNGLTQPPYPFDRIDQNKGGNGVEEKTKIPVPIDESPWIDVINGDSGKNEGNQGFNGGTRVSNQGQGFNWGIGIPGQGLNGRIGIPNQGNQGQGFNGGINIPGQGNQGQGYNGGVNIPNQGQGFNSGINIPNQGTQGQGFDGRTGIPGQGNQEQGFNWGIGVPNQGQGFNGGINIPGQGTEGQGYNGGVNIPNQGAQGQGFDGRTGIPGQGVFPSIPPLNIPPTTTSKTPLATGKGGLDVETWSPFSGEENSPNTVIPGGTTVEEGKSEQNKENGKGTEKPWETKTPTSGGLPFIPFIPLPGGIPTEIFQTAAPPSSFSPKFSQTSTTFISPTIPPIAPLTVPPTIPSTIPTLTTTVKLPPGLVVSDPHQFRLGLDPKSTTSAPGNLNCSERIKKAASQLFPSPFCDCPAGQMKNINGICVRSEISTFQAKLGRVCGEHLTDVSEEAQILTWKLSITLNYPVCVRKADGIIIFNTVCNKCEFADLIDQYAIGSDLPEVDVKLSELQNSACYEFEINDCNEKAECIPEGLRYRCLCLPGTTDSVDGSGRNCDGIVIANQCAKLLGVCILFWILLLLLLLVLLPIAIYFLCKYCKKRNVKIFDRFQKKKKRVEISPTVQTANLESGVTSLEKPEYYGTAQWDKGSVSTGRANIPTITTSVPRSIPLNQLLPKDEYSIIENDDDEDAASSKADAASIAASSDSTILNKTATNAVVQSDSEAARRPSTGSRSATPTIWETYKILGQQYTRFSSAKRRKSSTHSLENLLKKKQEEEFKKHSTALSLPDVDVEFNTALPPLPTVSVPQGKRRQLSRTDSKKSISSAKSEQSMKLAEMLGVSQPSIPEESIEAIAESTAADVINTVQRQIPFTFGSIPSTPDIQKAAENAVTDALRNVIGPQYDPKLSELQVAERLQTTTKASPTGSREDLPVIGKDTARTSTVAQKRRPGSGTSNKSRASNRSRTTLPSPTIEPNAEETTANLDAVAEALSQLPPIPVPSLPRLDGKVSSNTSPSTARKKKRPTSPKTARSLTSEKSIKFSSDSPKSARKTIASSLKEKPPMSKKKMQSSNPKSEEPGSVSQLQPISPKTARKPPSTVVLEPSKPITAPTFEKSKNLEKARNRLPPIYRQSSSTSLKPKRVSSNPPTRQLSNISERSENVQMQGDTSSINKIPISLPSTARGSNKTSKLPQLTDPKKANSVFCRCDTPEYMVADLDLDLPGPYMIPASSIEDLKRVGVSRLPRITSVSRSEPSSERLSKQNSLLRQSSTKSEDLWKSSRLPPIDVDLEDETAQDFDIDTSRIEKSEKYPTSTIARKIATRKAAGQDYSMKQKKMKMSDELSSQEIQYEYRRSTSKKSHIHDGCIRDQPPWDPTPLKDGEIEQIPLDWNLSRSNSQMSLGSRRTQSQGDLRNVTSLKIYSSISPRNMNEGNKSNSLTNLFHFEAQVPDLDSEWVNNLKTSLKKTNNWLDYD